MLAIVGALSNCTCCTITVSAIDEALTTCACRAACRAVELLVVAGAAAGAAAAPAAAAAAQLVPPPLAQPPAGHHDHETGDQLVRTPATTHQQLVCPCFEPSARSSARNSASGAACCVLPARQALQVAKLWALLCGETVGNACSALSPFPCCNVFDWVGTRYAVLVLARCSAQGKGIFIPTVDNAH